MSTDQHVASVLFDSTPTVETMPAAQEAATDEQTAEKILFAKEPEPAAVTLPENIAKLREGDSPLFDPRAAYGDCIAVEDLVETGDVTPDVKAAAVSEFKGMAHDMGLSPLELREVVALERTMRAEPPTAEVEQEWQQAACKRALELAGGDPKAALADLTLAAKLAQRDVRLLRILETTRLGNHPQVVALMIERARSERLKGRL